MQTAFVLLCCISIAVSLPSPSLFDSRENAFESDLERRLDSMKYGSNNGRYAELQHQARIGASSSKELLARLMLILTGPCPRPSTTCHVPVKENICGPASLVYDNRYIIDEPLGDVPYTWICRIRSLSSNGSASPGTAFKVKISPDIGRTVLFTAAHTLLDYGGGYAQQVTVYCPGDAAVTVVRHDDRDMWMSDEFLNSQNYLYDYAYITYAGNSNTGFGWQGFIDATALNTAGTELFSCGYPHYQETCYAECRLRPYPPTKRKLYCATGEVTGATANKITAYVDTDEGQSGGPLFERRHGNYIAYGIVSQGAFDCALGPSYQRLTAEKLYNMFSHIGDMQLDYNIESYRSSDVHLHVDGTLVDATRPLGGRVYVDRQIPGVTDDNVKVFPVYQSSSNVADEQRVAVRTSMSDNLYLRMDGTGVTTRVHTGGGTVNVRYGIDDGEMETFFLEVQPEGSDVYSLRSAKFPNVYLRMNYFLVVHYNLQVEATAQYGIHLNEKIRLAPITP